MARNTWTVMVDINVVRAACRTQCAFADGKVTQWQAEMNTKEAELRDRGLTLARLNSVPSTQYNHQQVLADPVLMDGFQQAQRKVDEWTARRDEFNQWLRLLELWRGAEIELDRQDIAFFRL